MTTARTLGLWSEGRHALPCGPVNAITDVSGLRVGHHSVTGDGSATGVTAIIPHDGDQFRLPPRAAVEVINGFGKSAGLMQIAELDQLETPILLTTTFGLVACCDALLRRAIAANPDIGRQTSTVSPVVCECNDGQISDIQALGVTRDHAYAALDGATTGPVEDAQKAPLQASRRLNDDLIDLPFRAKAEATQEAVLNALAPAPATLGRSGRLYPSLADWAAAQA